MKFALAYDMLSKDPNNPVSPRDLTGHALLAEKLGFDSIWAGESHGASPRHGHLPSPLHALSAICFATKRIRLGTGVLLLPIYDPLKLAEDVATIDCLSGGRVVLGAALGSGVNRDHFNVPRKDLGGRFEESISLIKELWTSPQVSHNGKHFTYQKVGVIPKPFQKPHPPILIGGGTSQGAERAAKLGDGWIGASNHSKDKLAVLVSHYKKTVPKGNRSFVAANRVLWVEKSNSGAVKNFTPYFTEFAKWYSERNALKDASGRDVDYVGDLGGAMEQFAIVGSAETCIDTIEKYAKIGVDQLNLRIRLPGVKGNEFERMIRLLSTKVFSYFPKRG
ncbi:MAG: LLM class flavin-dependent oxidoreductase [Thaumarchaeota archaeon]|nr:LLM class flavin-dependent oxidoreductase [Nitrososphaerota archaeon]